MKKNIINSLTIIHCSNILHTVGYDDTSSIVNLSVKLPDDVSEATVRLLKESGWLSSDGKCISIESEVYHLHGKSFGNISVISIEVEVNLPDTDIIEDNDLRTRMIDGLSDTILKLHNDAVINYPDDIDNSVVNSYIVGKDIVDGSGCKSLSELNDKELLEEFKYYMFEVEGAVIEASLIDEVKSKFFRTN